MVAGTVECRRLPPGVRRQTHSRLRQEQQVEERQRLEVLAAAADVVGAQAS